MSRWFRAQVEEVIKSALEGQRYQPERAWHSPARYSIFEGKGAVLNADGSVAWEEENWQSNALTNDGQADLLNVYLKAATQTTTFYLGLFTAASGASAPAKTNHSSDIINTGTATSTQLFEEAGGGYTRQSITNANWGTPALNLGDEMTTAAQKTFGPATGAAWTGSSGASAALTYAFLSTGASGTSGTLVLYVPLSATTIIAVGQSFSYTLNFKMQ